MLLFSPRKVQTEIDEVIGYERLASLAGQEFMPYFNPRGTEDGQHHTLNVPREVKIDTKLAEFHLLKVTPNLRYINPCWISTTIPNL